MMPMRLTRGRLAAGLAALVIGVPLLTVAYHARKSDKGIIQFIRELATNDTRMASAPAQEPAVMASPFESRAIGNAPVDHPLIAHVAASDLDQDGLLDVLVCDGNSNAVTWI